MKPVKVKRHSGIYRIGKKYYKDYYDPNGKRHREVAGSLLEDAVSRKGEIKDQGRKGKYVAERKKYTTTFDELIQKYGEVLKDQKCFGRDKIFALQALEK